MIRKRLMTFWVMALISLAWVGPATAAPAVFLNGHQLSFDVQPMVENERTLVPFRAIFEALGASVGWDQTTRTVTAHKSGTEIKLVIGQDTAYKNGSAVELDVPARAVAGRTLVPLRFVSETLGAQVNWNGDKQEVAIQSGPQSMPAVDAANVFTFTTSTDFKQGRVDRAEVTKDKDGEVQLAEINNAYCNQGVFKSEIIYTAPFSSLIASWNADTPLGTALGVEVQVLVDGEWSDWISWGTWSTNQGRASVKDDDNTKLAGISTDALYVRDGKHAAAFRLRTILSSADLQATPVLRSVSVTIDLGSGAQRVYSAEEDSKAIENVDRKLIVPAFSQFMRDPQIAARICSPTSATCVVDYYLEKYQEPKVLPEQSADAIYDSVYEGFGNWAFGASYIGSFGLNSRVEFCSSLYDLKREIYNGRPVIISLNYARNEKSTDPDLEKFPVLHGFPIEATWGHVLTVTGFTKLGGQEYVWVNDSAAASDVEAERLYLADELDAAWATSGRVAYTANDLDGAVYNPLPSANRR